MSKATRRQLTRAAGPSVQRCASGLTVVAVGLLALLCSLLYRSSIALALGAVLLTVPAVVYVSLLHSTRKLKFQRRIQDSATEGDEVEMRFAITNESRIPLFCPSVSERFAPEIHEEKLVSFPLRVRPGETVEGRYRGMCLLPRGVYALGPATIDVSDPFGWFHRRVRFGTRRTLKVYPRYSDLFWRDPNANGGESPLDAVSLRNRGDSLEFLAVREYRRGDPVKRIHWPLTAHRGQPIVREYIQTASGDLCVFLDLYRYALLGVGRSSSLEHAVRISAALTAKALRQGDRVAVTAFGKEEYDLPPQGGVERQTAVLDLLVQVRPDGEHGLDEVLERRRSRVMPGSTVVVTVSPYLHDSASFVDSLRWFRERGCRVFLLVFDDVTFRSIYEPSGSGPQAEEYLDRQRSAGFEGVLVPCAADLESVFLKAASMRS